MMAYHNENCGESSTEEFEKHRIKRAPSAVYYIPDFVTVEEENRLWNSIYTAPKPKWTVLSHRRLQNWGGLPHSKGMVPEPLPEWLSQYTRRVSDLGVFGKSRAANHVLVNEYTPGQGIMAHVDGPLFYPTISTLNIGSHTLLNLYYLADETEGNAKSLSERFIGSLLLEPRSLLILQQDAYTAVMHDIADTEVDLMCGDRVLNWNQTVIGGWATACQRERDRRGGIGSTSVSLYDEDDSTRVKEDGEIGTPEKNISPEGNDKCIIMPDLEKKTRKDYLDNLKLFRCTIKSLDIENEMNIRMETRSNADADSSTAVNGSGNDCVATGDTVTRKREVFRREIKFVTSQNTLLSEATQNTLLSEAPQNTLLGEAPQNTLLGEAPQNTLLGEAPATLALEVGHTHPPRTHCDCVPKSSFMKVCKSLMGSDHSRSKPMIQPLFMAGKECYLIGRATRISLTIRHVPKVVKTKIFLGRK